MAAGLKALGFARGDKLAIVGDNRPRLYWAIAATQALGGVPVPVYQDSIAEEMAYVLDHAEVRFVVDQVLERAALNHQQNAGLVGDSRGDARTRRTGPESGCRSARARFAHPARAGGGSAGSTRANRPSDRRPPLHRRANGGGASGQRVRQARGLLEAGARPEGSRVPAVTDRPRPARTVRTPESVRELRTCTEGTSVPAP